MKKTALVCGGGGFIGHHLVKRLKSEGYWVRALDLKHPEFSASEADDFQIIDLRDPAHTQRAIDRPFNEVYQLAADMGGAGYIFSGDNDATVMRNSALINLNVLESSRIAHAERIFFSSSACIYPHFNQTDPNHYTCAESTAYPAEPDSDYGWEKLFAERLYLAYSRNHGMPCRIARYHNIFGPEGTWQGGKEKAPAALCRKVALAADGDDIEVWGSGDQTRSFLYIDECIEGTLRLMRSDCPTPVNLGSDESIRIKALATMAADIAGKRIALKHIPGPIGVHCRTSDNTLIQQTLGWSPSAPLRTGMEITYRWIAQQVAKNPSL
ncbi:MAG TPA: NAD-dependent epimerase/dehydratase family protein [Pseudomonadales bacterium]